MSAFCNKYPECGCVGVGVKCYIDGIPVATPNFRKLADIEMALRLDGVAPAKPVSRNQPCPCGSKKRYKHCCAE